MQIAQGIGQRTQLLAVFAVAPEQDVARRLRVREEGALLVGQSGAGDAEDAGRHHGRMCVRTVPRKPPAKRVVWETARYRFTWQASPSAFSLVHSAFAAARLPGVAWRR